MMKWNIPAGPLAWLAACSVLALGCSLLLPLFPETQAVLSPLLSVLLAGIVATSILFCVYLAARALASRRPQADVSVTASPPKFWGGLLAVFLSLAAAIGATGYFYARHEATLQLQVAERALSSVGNLKADQISNWYREHITDARTLLANPVIQQQIAQFLAEPSVPDIEQELIAWFNVKAVLNDCEVFLYDRDGKARLSAPQDAPAPDVSKDPNFLAALHGGEVVISDLYRDAGRSRAGQGDMHLSFWIPEGIGQGPEGANAGALELRADPQRLLYPLVTQWPTDSPTAETLLVRRDGDEVVFLNQLRHLKNSPLEFRLPISMNMHLPAVQAVLGREGMVKAKDYRHVPTLAFVRGIPGSPWFLVSKVDLDEILSPLRRQAMTTTFVLVTLILASALGVGLLARRRDNEWLRQQLAVEHERQTLAERYRRFVEMSTEGVWRCDISPPVPLSLDEREQAEAILSRGRLAECNKTYLHHSGHASAEQALGIPLHDLLSGTHEEKVAVALRIIRSSYRTSSLETMNRLSDGRTVWTLNNIVAIEQDGQYICVWGTTRDITSRIWAEEKVRASEAQKNAILNGITSSITLVDRDLRVLWTNKTAAAAAKRPMEEIVGQSCHTIWGDGSRPCGGCPTVRAFRSGKSEQTVQVKPNGRVWDERGEPVFDGEGNVVAVVEIAEDITDRRRDDEERLLLATAVERSAEAVIITDAQGVVNYVNPAFGQIFGTVRNEALHAHVAGVINADAEQFAERLRETSEKGVVWRGRIGCMGAGGRRLVVEATASPIRDERGQTAELVILLHDVTKEDALEARVRQSQKLEAIGTLAGGIAHDFNNILSAIMGYTQIALDGIEPASAPARDLEQVLMAGRRAADLVRQIMTFGRKQDQTRLPVRLDVLAKEALALLRASIPSTITIHSRVAEDCGCVMGDPTQLQQVIMNLCTNAYHAMEKNGGRLEFTIEPAAADGQDGEAGRAVRGGAWVQIVVKDTGCGMDQATVERAFDPFFTTKPQGKGTGLGLSIAHGIVKNHEGTIDIQSEPGKGTAVRVLLPTVGGGAQESAPGTEAPLSGHGEHILFVDDEAMLVKLVERMLTGLGYTVTASCDPVGAIGLVRANPDVFDLIITDQTMPHCTGLELAAAVQEIRPGLPIVLASGLDLVFPDEDIKAVGVTETLGKPISSYKLAKVVSRALASARGKRQG